MPDTPIIVDGNNEKFTISLPSTVKDPKGRKIVLNPKKKALSVRVETDEGKPVVLPLGNNWKIVIDEPDKLPG